MSLNLSKRMQKIVDLCDSSDIIVDIGTDHGLIPIALANSRKASHIIATDIKSGPIEACIKNKEKYLIDKQFDFQTLISDGLEKIDKNKKYNFIISGMGYDAMCEILTNIDDYNFNFLILSPHTKINEFVKFISKKNVVIDKIETVFEDDQVYFIVKAYKKEIYERLYGEVNEN